MEGFLIFELGISGWGLFAPTDAVAARACWLVDSMFYSHGARKLFSKTKQRKCDTFGLNHSGHLRGGS